MALRVCAHALQFFPWEFALRYNRVSRTRSGDLPSLAAVHEVNPPGRPIDSEASRSAPCPRPSACEYAVLALPDPEVSSASPVAVPRVVDGRDEVTRAIRYVIRLGCVEILRVVLAVGETRHR
jgi:hypothetical protein